MQQPITANGTHARSSVRWKDVVVAWIAFAATVLMVFAIATYPLAGIGLVAVAASVGIARRSGLDLRDCASAGSKRETVTCVAARAARSVR